MKHEIKIPTGCSVKFSIENGMAITEIEGCGTIKLGENQVDEPKFKENDILTCEMDGNKWVAIFKDKIDNFSFNAKVVYVCDTNDINKNDWASCGRTCRIANDSEKQLLFDKLKEKCLMFDGQNVVRWRADVNKDYFYTTNSAEIINAIDNRCMSSNLRYSIGNYFPTKEMAEEFQKKYIELLNNFHKNL